MKDVGKIKAATLVAHGNNDFNVMTKNAAQFYEALKAKNVAAPVLLPSGRPRRRAAGLADQPVVHEVPVGPGQRRREPAEVVGRALEAGACPPRETTVTGDQSNTATLTVASAAPFRVGDTLTVPQTNANGTITTPRA